MNLLSTSKQEGRPEGLRHSELSTTAESHVPNFRTTPAERFLLFATVLILPLEEQIPSVAGFSSLFFMFAVLAAYVAINRLQCLDRVWMHPVFVAAYLFIGFSVVLEFASPSSSYGKIASFALMVVGALLVASLCRDRAALKVFLYGYIGAALWLGALLFLTSYGALSGASATGFHEASKVRNQAFSDNPIQANLNSMAFDCAEGAIVAVAFALGSASVRVRNFFAAIGIFCLVASFLPMSRGAVIAILVSCGAMLKANGIRHVRVWLLVAVTAISAVLLVPDSVWERMVVMQPENKMEKRAMFYVTAWQYVEDYIFMGVGAGNYFNKWGFEHGFAFLVGSEYRLWVVHNAFLQVLIFWGMISLLVYLAIIWLAYRCLPRTYGKDVLVLSMLGIAVSLLMLMPFSSNFSSKGFSLGLGMLVAYQRWLSPRSVAQLENR
jgi:heme exporter protein D